MTTCNYDAIERRARTRYPRPVVGRAERFETELVEGHKGVVVAIVPFDPETVFRQKPVRLAGRRHGWLVTGSLDGKPFDGYVGERWGRFFIIIEPALRRAAGVGPGDTVSMAVTPTRDEAILARAIAQSSRTTQPAKARADVAETVSREAPAAASAAPRRAPRSSRATSSRRRGSRR